ncbi:pyridoxamine 5'-phosphate oxidase family protein [Mesorhizobium sp. SB112]|uniref:HugZ family pyridoxamine 5'-phosphate oxidase n=1 Tax=Mesorhizobium sp. SB112 TaxID=3151853 RepID=UPI003265741D
MLNDLNRAITPRGLPIDEEAGIPFAALKVARELLHTASIVSLSTLDPVSAYPYGTLTNLALEPDGSPFFFVARLALHARNIEADNRISLTLTGREHGDVLVRPRLTLVGKAILATRDEWERMERRYLARYPKAKIYLSLPDAQFYRLETEDLQLNGGPARNVTTDVTSETLKIDLTGADALLAAEQDEIERINSIPDEASRIAAVAGAKQDRWRVTGIDPEGIHFSGPKASARLWFPSRVLTVDALRERLS